MTATKGSPVLRYGSDGEPGFRRLGRARFHYVDADGRPAAADEVARIRALVIPPAWTDVWIAPAADWHLQATGRDAKGRKQYRYHDGYREEREAAKFDDLRRFGLDLTRLRRAVQRDLAEPDLCHDRVVAAIVRLLDATSLRVGNEEYARTNGSFGLTTLRNRHVHSSTRSVRLQFRGKSAHDFDVTIADPKVAKVVRGCQHLPGQLLFQYAADGGDVHPVTSTDVNTYLQRHACSTATAKTFRTWGASVMGASLLAAQDEPSSGRVRSRSINSAVRQVAEHLGNTLTVCKRSYIHPAVYDAYDDGELAKRWDGEAPARPSGLAADERRFWNLIDEHGG
ncbi:MAG: topoisomerase [Ilumatobacteraceae bacterium]|nr:topoisomerase [Ilumatobacteraceae bacterium]